MCCLMISGFIFFFRNVNLISVFTIPTLKSCNKHFKTLFVHHAEAYCKYTCTHDMGVNLNIVRVFKCLVAIGNATLVGSPELTITHPQNGSHKLTIHKHCRHLGEALIVCRIRGGVHPGLTHEHCCSYVIGLFSRYSCSKKERAHR